MEEGHQSELEAGGQEEKVTGLSHGPPGERTFKLKRRFYQCIKNTPRENAITKDKVELNWYNVPYNDQRFYWTPATMAEVKACGDLMKVTEIGVNLHGFRAAFDIQMDLGNNTKVTATPTKDPTLFTYIHSKHILPVRDRLRMNQKEIKTNLVFQADKTDCIYKKWETENTTHTQPQRDGSTVDSNDPSDFYMWAEDFEFANQEEFAEIPLSGNFGHKQTINMPWMLTSGNILPHANAGDKIGVWDFPKIVKGRIEEKELMWITRSYRGPRTTEQATAVNWEPWEQEIPDMLIRGYPITTEIDVEVPYTIWFWADFEATIVARKCKWIYGHKTTFPHKHWGAFPAFGTGKKVEYDVATTAHYEHIPNKNSMSKVA